MSMRHLPYPPDFTTDYAAAHQVTPRVACAEEVPHAR